MNAMKILLMIRLSVMTMKSSELLMVLPTRVRGRRFLCVIEMLLMSFLSTMMVMPSVEAAGVKYLTLVSVTFDDGLRQSAAIQPLLDTGLKATFYVNSDQIRFSGPIDNADYLTKGELDTLFNNGNEIGGHTINHVNLATLSDAAQLKAICDDLATLRGWYDDQVFSFAYPFSSTGPTTQSIVAGGCPGTYGPLNKPIGTYESARAVGGIGCSGCPVAESLLPHNPYFLSTIESVTSTTTLAQMQSYVTQAELNGGGWVTLVFHAVCDGCTDSLGVTPNTFRAFLEWLKIREPQSTYVRTVHQVMSGDYPPPPPPPPLGPNLLINPSLELDQDSNNQPDCWQRDGWGTNTVTWTRTTDAFTGSFAQRLQITAYTNGDRKLLPTLDAGQIYGECAPSVETGATYQLSTYYKSTTSSTVVLFYLDATGVWQYWRDGPILPASNDWAQMTHNSGPLPAGAQAMSFGIALTGVGTLTTDEYSMAKVLDAFPPSNTIPTFTGGTPTLTVVKDSPTIDLKPNLHVSDTDTGQTETWSPSAAPVHGTLVITGATASSGSADITPGGTLTYQPVAGYSGSDSFTVQVSDGTASATRTFAVTVTAPTNTAPTFTGGTTTLTVVKDSPAVDLKPNLHVSDTDIGQTETWSSSAAPAHGTLVITGATASSGSADITPGGTLTYQPVAGYSGSDSFTVQVSDGIASATRSFAVTVNTSTNLLINPSLELDQNSNNQPDCWQRGGWGTNTVTWTRTTDAFTGSFAQQLQITTSTNGDRKLLPTLDAGQISGGCAPSVEANAVYQISAYYKSTTTSTIVLFYLNANGVWQYWRDGPTLPASNVWVQMVHDTGPLPTGAKAVSFGIALTRVGTLTTDEYSMVKVR